MSDEGTFKPVDENEQVMYGPRGLLLVGFSKKEQDQVTGALEGKLAELKVVFATEDAGEETLGDLLGREAFFGRGSEARLERAVVMSGISQRELHTIMQLYKGLGLPSPLWAALTPTSETWKLNNLLKELSAERKAFQERKGS
jgi:hypothetical protein